MPRFATGLPLPPRFLPTSARAVRPTAASAPSSLPHHHHLWHRVGSRCVVRALVPHSRLCTLATELHHRQSGLPVLRRPAHRWLPTTPTDSGLFTLCAAWLRTCFGAGQCPFERSRWSRRNEHCYRCAMPSHKAVPLQSLSRFAGHALTWVEAMRPNPSFQATPFGRA